MDDIRNQFGYCLQKDILFDKLTVNEHLKLVCLLKNMNQEQTERSVN